MALDASTLQVRFVASLGPWRVRGAFGALHGTLVLPDGVGGGGSGGVDGAIAVDVSAASVDTGLPMRDRHLRGASFLDAGAHPHISFRSQRVRREGDTFVVAGVLTMCGIAHEVVVHATVAPSASARSTAPEGGEGARLIATATLRVPIRRFGVGLPRGRDVLNPIFRLIGDQVEVTLRLAIPASGNPASPLSDRGR